VSFIDIVYRFNIDSECSSTRHTIGHLGSGAGTNLKVGGGTGPERKWGTPEKNFLVVPLHFFALKAQFVVFGERFRDGQYSLVSFFAVLLLAVPPVPSHM